MITKIQSISPNGSYNYGTKTFYQYDIRTESGELYTAATPSTSPWWREPGSTVKLVMKNKRNDQGIERVVVHKCDDGSTESAESSSYTSYDKNEDMNSKSYDADIGIQVGQALNKAVDVMVATSLRENGLNPETFIDELREISESIITVGFELREKLKNR